MALVTEIKVLEILERAKSGGEIVDWKENESNVKEEVLRRSAKAGLSEISGKIIMKPANAQYRKNYRKIFGHD